MNFRGWINPMNKHQELSPEDQIFDLQPIEYIINTTNKDLDSDEGKRNQKILSRLGDGRFTIIRKNWLNQPMLKWFELKDGKIVQKQP